MIGHLGGVKKMVEDDRYCVDVIQQNLGVIAALHKVNENILRGHLEICVNKAIKYGTRKERGRALEEVMEIFKRSKSNH